jgi:hypothetical protein
MAVFQLIMKLLAINEDSQSALFWAIGIQSTSWEAFSYNSHSNYIPIYTSVSQAVSLYASL